MGAATGARYFEIDFARGIAVVLMVAYHLIFDASYPDNGPFMPIAIVAASAFIFVSGISLSISFSRGAGFRKLANRGFRLILLGLAITALSFAFLSGGYIIFGILSFFGVTSFLAFPFLKIQRKYSTFVLVAAVSFLLAGFALRSFVVDSPYLIWLGAAPADFTSFDYFPILPWFGFMLAGVYAGSSLYPGGDRSESLGFIVNHGKGGALERAVEFCGRNSLYIYFLHQPVIIALLYFAGIGSIPHLIGIG